MVVVSLFLQGAYTSFLFFAARRYFQSDAFHHRVAGMTLFLWLIQSILRLANYATAPPLPLIHTALSIFDMTAIPACAFVLFSLTGIRKLNHKRLLIHETPFIAALVLYLISQSQWVFYITFVYSLLYGVVMFTTTLRDVKQYEKQICMIYSDLEHRTLNWLLCVVWMFFIMLIVWTAFTFICRPMTDILFYCCCMVLWHRINLHLVDHLAIKEEDVNESVDIDTPIADMLTDELTESTEDSDDSHDAFGFGDELIRLMEEEKAYLNPSLTINDVAQSLGTNRTYLSRHINNELKLNFFDFVNQYRIAMAEKMLLGSNKSIDTIASETGFNSTMNFRRVFARTHDCTPGQFRAQAAQK